MPTPQQTTAQTQAMTLAAQHCNNAAQAIATIANQVQEAVSATTGGYDTPASALFLRVMNQWSDDIWKIIVPGLNAIHEALVHTALNYNAAMNADQDSANQIAALLNGLDV